MLYLNSGAQGHFVSQRRLRPRHMQYFKTKTTWQFSSPSPHEDFLVNSHFTYITFTINIWKTIRRIFWRNKNLWNTQQNVVKWPYWPMSCVFICLHFSIVFFRTSLTPWLFLFNIILTSLWCKKIYFNLYGFFYFRH